MSTFYAYNISLDRRNPHFALQSPSQNMSQLEIYQTAKLVRAKLLKEARLKDHNLFRLVGHANMYDKLLVAYSNYDSSDDGQIYTHAQNATNCQGGREIPPHSADWIGTNQQDQYRGRRHGITRSGSHLPEGTLPQWKEKDRDARREFSDECMKVSIREVEIVDEDD